MDRGGTRLSQDVSPLPTPEMQLQEVHAGFSCSSWCTGLNQQPSDRQKRIQWASTDRRNHLCGHGELDLIEVLAFLGRQITFQPVSTKIIYMLLDFSQKNILKRSPFWSGRASPITSSSNLLIFSCSRECGCWPSATMVNHWEEYQFSTALLPPVHIWALLNTLWKSHSGKAGRGGGIAQWERGRDSPMRSIKLPLRKDLDCFPSDQMIMGRKR